MLREILSSNPVVLAPMAGILDRSMRLALREVGWGVSWIGSIDARAVAARGNGELINILGKKEIVDPSEKPLVLQLIGNDADILSHAASLLEDQADVFDLNLGCPLHIAISKGMGAAMMKDSTKMLNTLKSFVRSTRKPVTAKMRLLSADRAQETVNLAKRIEDAGISGLIIHARTPEQKFSGKANWEALLRVKMNLSVPVIGSGGIRTLSNIIALRENAGLDGIMVGAGAIRNPFLVRECREYAMGIPPERKRRRDILQFASLYAKFACRQESGISATLSRFTQHLHYLVLRLRLELFVARQRLERHSFNKNY
jgi:tRNA-dihydrouridine synthase B